MIPNTPFVLRYSRALCLSFERLLGRPLAHDWVGSRPDSAVFQDLATFSCPVVSHGVQSDPIFCYGNEAALRLWAMKWDEFTLLPSRQSAEAAATIQNDRSSLLKKALEKGYVENYEGVRISASGQRFMITETVLWNVSDEAGVRLGQAARIGKVIPL